MYISETQKIRPIVQKYLSGKIIDLGCGNDLISPSAIGVDARKLPNVSIVTNKIDSFARSNPSMAGHFDVVFSSHCLEHIKEDDSALFDWSRLLKEGGHMILYLPDDRHYDNAKNPEHLHRYTLESFLQKLSYFSFLSVVESGMHIDHDCYSFWVVCKRV